MRPASFDYAVPDSLAAAVQALERGGPDAKLIAGGQSLMPMMNFRLARPELLVDLRRVPGLAGIAVEADRVVIGAMTTHAEIERSAQLARVLPVLGAAAREIGHPAIRNRGTIGGSLAHADPAAEWPVVAAALDASVRVTGPRGERTVPARELFVSYLTTALQDGEIVTAVEIPIPPAGTGWSFQEFARQAGAFALVMVVALAALDGEGRVARLAVALGGVDSKPVLAGVDAGPLLGAAPSRELVAAATEEIVATLEPSGDVHVSGEDRRQAARALLGRGLSEALARAGAPDLDTEGRTWQKS
ncbi:MAG: aerobic carbon-monoxide dehydrogenase medium subunit [Solirubrobacteraceae bacterium]|jgi:carbon-monoxide dehydrogenase medium subunit|nr:aerobic carbon-monoxide dehydrogenase medium subunit [Solirubrobacteraceae bacterium]